MQNKYLIILLFNCSLLPIVSQGISIGSLADISINALDGEQFPSTQFIEFNLGEVKGNFTLEINGYFDDSGDIPNISRFQGLINMYHSSSQASFDYRHINDNEVLTVSLSDINITEGYELFIEGMNGRMLEEDVIVFENSTGAKDTIIGTSDNSYYAVLPEMMPVAENDTVRIITLEGAWRLDYLKFLFIKELQKSDYLKFINTEAYVESTFEISAFGRYYLKGDHLQDDHPMGLSALVIDEKKDTIRNNGRYAFESDQFLIDLGILRQGDEVLALLGKSAESDPSLWNVELIREPHYHSSYYPDPDEIPLSLALPLDQLDIFQYGHPRVFSFRNDYLAQWGYDTFYSTVVQTQGAAPKCLAEERILSQQNLPQMQQFAIEHPEKIILNHFSFDGMMVNYVPESYDFFSKEHWCYYPGTYLEESLLPEDSIVNLVTASRFLAPNNDGTAYKNDVVIIIPLDSLGKKNWTNAEYAAIKQIDNNSLTLLRGLFNTVPNEFPAGSYIAPTFSHSGWNLGHELQGYRGDETYFFYNWSADCPLDSLGRDCSDAFTEFYETMFKRGGKFERFHGVMADVWRGNNDDRPINQSEIYSRKIDHNVDGKADGGFDERGYNLIAYGQHDFARKFRKLLGPDRIWTADGNGSHWPRAIPFLSGIESEGFDYHHDAFLKGWSGAINRFSYYKNNLDQENQFNVAVPKILDYEEEFPDNEKTHHLLRRLARAATTILELNNCANGVKTGEKTPNFWLADDYVMGVADSAQWLGEPVGEIIRPAQDSADLLDGAGQNLSSSFVTNWSSTDANIFIEEEALCVEGIDEGIGVTQERMHIQFPMNIPEGDLFIRFKVKADSLRAFTADFPRYFFVKLNGLQSTVWTWKTLEGMAGSSGYEEMSFYYRQAGPANVNIEIEFEGYEKVWIKDFTVHNAQDVMAREFEQGVVLVNPSANPFLFELDQLFPDKSFRFIEGHEYEDFLGINNGNPIQGPILLNAHTGKFLVKENTETSVRESSDYVSDLRIYPVPSDDELNILFSTHNNGACSVIIQDIQGKTVYSKNETILSGENRFKIQSLDFKGVYFLTLMSEEIIITRKIVFQ